MIGGISGQLSALAIETRGVRSDQAEAEVERAQKEHDDAVAAAEEAARKAAEAAEDGGFWDDVGSVMGDVALVAGVVAACAVTGGGAAAIVVAAGAATQLGGRLLEEAGVDSKITGGMQLAGGLTVAVGSAFTGAGALPTLAKAASLTSAAAGAGKGVSMAASGHYQSEALDHQADGVAAMGQAGLADVESDRSLGDMQQAVKGDLALEAAARDLEAQIQKHRTQMIAQIGGA
jgi:hypothetical protein